MTTTTNLVRCFVDSPVGRLRLVAADAGLVGLYFPEHRHGRDPAAHDVESHPVLDLARRELAEYFTGRRTRFETPLAPPALRGGTEFQLAVWNALLAIPFGETRSYGDIARSLGRPNAVRAVGTANAHNPISILVPCHRVIGGGGSLTGYAGGIEAKRWLLAHEGKKIRVRVRSLGGRSSLAYPRPTRGSAQETTEMAQFMYVFRGGGYATPGSLSPTEIQQHLAQWNAWTKTLLEAGRLAGAHALEHPATGKTLRGRDRIVTDGPYAESKDLVSGSMLIEAASLAEATELARECPIFEFDGSVEVRPVLVPPKK